MILSLLLFAAQAEAEPYCSDPASFTQAELNWCAWQNFREADKELNRLWGAVGSEWRDDMRPAQKAWLAYRDAQCELEGSIWEGGSAQSMVVGMCLERLTRARIVEIRQTHPEGLWQPEGSRSR